jgi:hypothetical protein
MFPLVLGCIGLEKRSLVAREKIVELQFCAKMGTTAVKL